MSQLTVGHDEAQKRLNSVFRPTYRKKGRKKKGGKGREGKLKRKRERKEQLSRDYSGSNHPAEMEERWVVVR